MKLYGYWRSSSSWRVRIALHHKGLAFENVPVHLVQHGGEQHRDDFVAKNPRAEVPVLELEHGGRRLSVAQSLAIIELLEELHPEPALLPAATPLRAKVRQLAEMVNAGIQPFQNLAVLEHLKGLGLDSTSWAQRFIAQGLLALEVEAKRIAGTFLAGDAVSLADACLVPQLYSARRFSVPLEPYPTLLRVEAACAALPAFVKAHAHAQPDAPRS